MKDKFQHFKRPIIEIIKSRYSVRTYRPEKLSDEVKNQLRQYSKGIEGPFSPKVRLELIDSSMILGKSDGKIGTYGIIKGAQDYIAAIVKSGEKDYEQLGYILEKLILFATSLELGTCWLGGTFKKSEFVKLVELKETENEILPIVSPIGYPGNKKSVVDSVMRFSAGSNKRKSWEELFFNESFSQSMEKRYANEYAEAFEAVRLAPSASNKQPWRILREGKSYHFYLKSNKGLGEGIDFNIHNIHRIDMGIAMCHFEMTLQELGIKGIWKIDNPNVKVENLLYSVSWIEVE